MPVIALTRAIADTKIRFSLVVLVLAGLITIGSLYLIGYLRYEAIKQMLFAQSLQVRAEYIAQQQKVGFFDALQAAFGSAPLTVSTASSSEGVPVLTYHSILTGKNDSAVAANNTSEFEGANVSLAHFKEQMFALKAAGWQTVTYEDFDAFMHGKKKLPAKSFLLTFDDGAKQSFYPVDPILTALGYQAVAFILPSHSLGTHSTYYLNLDELQLMRDSGHWSIESHGQDIHVSLPTNADGSVKDNALSNRVWLPAQNRLETHAEYEARIQNDLSTAKRNLQNALGTEVAGFAFPFGDYGQNASNDSQAQATVLGAAKQNYTLAFYQNWNRGNFTFNYPSAHAFLVKRIPVKPNWTGDDLLAVLNAASPKALPYKGVPSEKNGWQSDWGIMGFGTDGMSLAAGTSTTGGLAVLDGSYTWQTYEVEAPVEWESGYVMVLFNLQSEQLGRACVFGDNGTVQLQERTKNDILILRETKVKSVKPGSHTIGAVSAGNTTACVFDGEYVIDATLPPASGGVGLEAWAPENGQAQALFKNISVTSVPWH
jgi:peptidoglycan/xylan/chitin deacetylase (PgdA/CDA1 family)